MGKFLYRAKGVCPSQISFDMEDGIVTNVVFDRGCDGNTTGISKLVDGLPADYIIAKLKGIKCGAKGTSCPDQLARAIEEMKLQQID